MSLDDVFGVEPVPVEKEIVVKEDKSVDEQLKDVISKGSSLFDTAKLAFNSLGDGELLPGAASLMSTIISGLREVNKTNNMLLQHQLRVELEREKHIHRLELQKEKNKFGSFDIEEGNKDKIPFNHSEIIAEIINIKKDE